MDPILHQIADLIRSPDVGRQLPRLNVLLLNLLNGVKSAEHAGRLIDFVAAVLVFAREKTHIEKSETSVLVDRLVQRCRDESKAIARTRCVLTAEQSARRDVHSEAVTYSEVGDG